MFSFGPTINLLVGFIKAFGGLCWLAILVASAHGDELTEEPSADSQVLARTGTQTITAADIDFLLGRSSRSTDAEQLPNQETQPLSFATQATAIELLALQRQALATLRNQKHAASVAEIDNAIRAGAPPEQSDWSVAQLTESHTKQSGVDPAKFRDSVDFRLAWPRYLQLHLTEENLRKHFETQRRRFDGTRFKIDLITRVVPVGQSPARARAQQRLTDLRTQLMSAQDSWEQIVERASGRDDYSLTRSRWVRGSGDLVPGLITPLLELERDQLSQLIHTTTGVHLIRWIESEPGDYELAEVRGDVRTHMLLFLLEYLARQSAAELPLVNQKQ